MVDENERRNRRRTWRTGAGAIITIAWAAFWVFAIWGDYAAGALVKRDAGLTLVEWSVLAAGVAAPVALLWLVLGYFQQGDELARNTDALRAQARETAALFQEYARQAAASATLAELEVAAHRRNEEARRALLAPSFRIVSASFSAGHDLANLKMVNIGGTAYALRFHSEDFAKGQIKPSELIERNAAFMLHVGLDSLLQEKRGTFTISCKDIEGCEHAFAFRNEDGMVVPMEGPPQRSYARSGAG